jgi:DNA gyrase subunit A
MEKLAKEVQRGRVTGVTDLRDESDYTGMRLVIEVSRTANPDEVLDQVLKYSQLRETFGAINLALIATEDGDSRPTYLSLRDLLTHFLLHRLEVIERRSKHELANRRARLHIVEGLLTALDVLDEVIATIRRSREPRTARKNLMRGFGFTELQADAILHTQLQQLARLGRTRLEDEARELRTRIEYLEGLVVSEKRRLNVIGEEMAGLKDRFAIPRRTVIVDSEDKAAGTTVMTSSDLVTPEADQVLVLTPDGVARCDAADFSYRPSDGLTTRSARSVYLDRVRAKPEDEVILLSSRGRGWRGQVGFVPVDAGPAELGLKQGEGVIAIGVLQQDADLLLGTRAGKVKRSPVSELSLIDREWGPVIGLDRDDELLFGDIVAAGANGIFYTREGQLLRLDADEINPQKTDTAGGVIGIALKKGDGVLGGMVVPEGANSGRGDDPKGEWQVVVVSETGYANRVPLAEFPVQGRNTQGVQCLRETKSGGRLGGVGVGKGGDGVDVYLADGRRFHASDLSSIASMTRGSRGKRLMEVRDSKVVRVVVLP